MASVSLAQGLGLMGTGGPGPPSSRSPLGLVSEPHVAAVFPPGGAQGTAPHGHPPEPVLPDPHSGTEPWATHEGPSGYSDLASIRPTPERALTFACLYESGTGVSYEEISFCMFSLQEVLGNVRAAPGIPALGTSLRGAAGPPDGPLARPRRSGEESRGGGCWEVAGRGCRRDPDPGLDGAPAWRGAFAPWLLRGGS